MLKEEIGMSKTETKKASTTKKATRKTASASEKSANGKKEPSELSANDMMFKAWQRIYKNRNKRLD